MVIVLLGAPGSGKGTLSNFLIRDLNFSHISTGDLFRKNIKDNTKLGKKIQNIVKVGALVPDKITNKVMKNEIKSLLKQKKDLVIDGYPRSLKQAKYLNKVVDVDWVLLIEIDKTLAFKRIIGRRTCPVCNTIYNIYFNKPKIEGFCDKDNSPLIQRKDDNESSFNMRFGIYEKTINEMRDFYKKFNNFKILNADVDFKILNEEAKKIINK